MKTIISPTFNSLPLIDSLPGARRTEDENARLRRDAERVQRRRQQQDMLQRADAEDRLAEAMARATARSAQLARSAQRSTDGQISNPAISRLNEVASADLLAATGKEIEPCNSMANAETASATADRVRADPMASLLARLATGPSRGLLKDCTPMLELLASRLAGGSVTDRHVNQSEREALAAALDFLQGYIEASTGRIAEADKMASLVAKARQGIETQLVQSEPTSVVAVADQKIALQTQTAGKAAHLHKGQERVRSIHKATGGADDDEHLTDSEFAAGAAIAGSGTRPEKMVPVNESSLDKDQRKRREDTLPLVTLRSI